MKWIALPFRVLAALCAGAAMLCGVGCLIFDGAADALRGPD